MFCSLDGLIWIYTWRFSALKPSWWRWLFSEGVSDMRPTSPTTESVINTDGSLSIGFEGFSRAALWKPYLLRDFLSNLARPKTCFFREAWPGSCPLWQILACPVLTHSKYRPWFVECSVGLAIGAHGHCSRCVLTSVVLTVKQGTYRGTPPQRPLPLCSESDLGPQMSPSLLSAAWFSFWPNTSVSSGIWG